MLLYQKADGCPGFGQPVFMRIDLTQISIPDNIEMYLWKYF